MSSISATSANQNSSQQLSSVIAKRNADQAEQIAQALRKKADAAQVEADAYKQVAINIDSQATKAENNSNNAQLRLGLSDAFVKASSEVTNTMKNAVVTPSTTTTATTQTTNTASITKKQTIGTNVNVVV